MSRLDEPPTGGQTRGIILLFAGCAVAVFAAASLHAATVPTKLTVAAGDFDRRNTVVMLQWPDANEATLQLVGPKNETAMLQVEPAGRATFIERDLAKGASKTYQVRPTAQAIAGKVTLTQAAANVRAAFANRTILQYQTTPSPVPEGVAAQFSHGAYLHPVFSPTGKLVTGDYPPDHRHQRGIWFAWTKTEFEGGHPDFWNMRKDKDGKFTGEVRFDKVDRTWSGAVHGGFVSQHRWIDHTSGAEKDILRETWDVTVFRPTSGAQALHIFDLTSTQTCASDAPLKLPKYHYGGLGVRGNAAWDPKDKVTMLTSEGHDRKTGDATKAKWVHIGGEVEGGLTGIVVLIHPDDFRFPQPLRLNPGNPQLCVAPSQDGDWEITPGKPYVSRYRIVVFDGKPDAVELERLWNDYAHPPSVTVPAR